MLQQTLDDFRNLTTKRLVSAILDFDETSAELTQVFPGIKYTDIITIQY